jgi:heat shock protein HslJ
MNNRARWTGIAALAVALAVAGCSMGSAATPPPNLEGTKWRVVEIAGQPTLGGNPPTLSFGADRIRGDTGCNTFSAGVDLGPGTIDVSSINSSLRLCEGRIGETETQFMRALVGAKTIAFDAEGNLIVDGDGGEVHFIARR